MTAKKKRIMQASALLLGSFVLAQTVLSEIPENTFAKQSFNGIESLIQSHDETDPFTIVELVPDASYAKLGYLVGGSEPFYFDATTNDIQTYEQHLAALTSPEERANFYSETAAKLSSITSTETEERPLAYQTYEESYVQSENDLALALDHEELIEKGSTAYGMEEAEGGAYTKTEAYALSLDEDGNLSGNYDQNVSFYVVGSAENVENAYYQLSFAANADLADGETAYVVSSEEPLVDEAELELVKSTGDFANLYLKENDTDTFVKVESADQWDETSEVYRVYFAVATVASDDAVYYTIAATTIGTSGSYGAVLDEQSPYVPAENGNGAFTLDISYTYVGEGNGQYHLIQNEDESEGLDADVAVSTIYYHGGFSNNEWFKKYVFNRDAEIALSVVALTPEQFADYAGEMDLLYISGSYLVETSEEQRAYYGENNDLSDTLAEDIYTKAASESTYLPVILDYAILQNESIKSTNVYKLAQRLSAQDSNSDNYGNGYVNGNVYVIPVSYDSEELTVSSAASASFLSTFGSTFLDCSNETDDAFITQATAVGFGEVADTIVSENQYRQVENEAGTGNTYEYFEQKLSAATVVEYIISYASKRQEYQLNTIQVLDIEPCTVTAEKQNTIENNIRSYLQMTDENADAAENVVVTHMSSAEFISKVEDLCKYDMIYMGLYTDSLNTDPQTGRTIYNDTDMNGLVYTNIGDIQYDSPALGLLDTEYQSTGDHYSITKTDGSKLIADYSKGTYVRYSGNDFTNEKVKAIENFVKSGAPVILAENFLTEAGGTTYVYDFPRNADGSKNTSEQGYIDNCSKVYELIESIKDRSNVFRENEVSGNVSVQQKLLSCLTLGKPVLSVTTAAKVSGQEYVKMNGSVVSFDFSIENYGSADANATFDCVLFADYNADGRYSNTTERISANDFSITLNGVKQTVQSKTDEDGTTYYYYELSPNTGGETYHLEYSVSSSYVGVLPVKIKVSQSGNDYRYASDAFYFYKERTSQEKLKIHVLQILPTSGDSLLNIGEEGRFDGALETTSAFYHYLHALADYDISIDAMYATTYVQMYEDDPNLLDDYDMLVLGFANNYDFLEKHGELNEAATIAAYQGIKDFIASGKSVLFTHDTTSYISNPNTGYDDWGFTLSQLLTADVGFDRYGVSESLLLKAGIHNLTQDGTASYNVSDYQSLQEAADSGILDADKTSYTEGELYDAIVAEATANNKDIAYKPNSEKKVLTSEVQGRSSITINSNGGLALKNVKSAQTTSSDTSSVELINEGQILIYPYNILTEIKDNDNILNVTRTHGQYFQIDMNEDADADGESDITVWLSLAGDFYTSAQKDARNNYYIYTKGNVTYSGVGHLNMDCDYTAYAPTKTAEIKLYINTMVAAYQSAAHAPALTLTDEDGSAMNVIYVGVDSVLDASGQVAEETQIDQGTEKVYLTVRDDNDTSAGYRKISVEYYLAYGSSEADLPDGVTVRDVVNIGTDADPIYAKKCNWNMYSSNKTLQDPTNLSSGGKYYVEVPYNIVDETQSGKAQIYVIATTSLWNEGDDVSTSDPSATTKTSETFYVQKLGLFDLE